MALGVGLAAIVPIAASYIVTGVHLPSRPVTALLSASLLSCSRSSWACA
jgi:hypothetical protein